MGWLLKKPDRYISYGDTLVAVSDMDYLVSYNQAMAYFESNLWLDAMKVEMHSMYVNKVWKLLDLPEGIKPVGCKWIYKKKRGLYGNVETFKARLVEKRYTQ